MSAILHNVTIRGAHHTWGIETYISKETAADWRADGLIVDEVCNTIPKWWVDMGGSVRLWCFVQDVFNFKNPWAK